MHNQIILQKLYKTVKVNDVMLLKTYIKVEIKEKQCKTVYSVENFLNSKVKSKMLTI